MWCKNTVFRGHKANLMCAGSAKNTDWFTQHFHSQICWARKHQVQPFRNSQPDRQLQAVLHINVNKSKQLHGPIARFQNIMEHPRYGTICRFIRSDDSEA